MIPTDDPPVRISFLRRLSACGRYAARWCAIAYAHHVFRGLRATAADTPRVGALLHTRTMFVGYALRARPTANIKRPYGAHTFSAPSGRLTLTGGKRSVTPGGKRSVTPGDHTSPSIRRIAPPHIRRCAAPRIKKRPIGAHTFSAPSGRLTLTGGKRSVTP